MHSVCRSAGPRSSQSVRSAIEAALRSSSDFDPPPGIAFVYSRGPDVMLLFGSEMTTQPLIEAAGGIDVGTASGVTGTVSVTPEAIVAAAPDVIIITSEGLQALGGEAGLLADSRASPRPRRAGTGASSTTRKAIS